MTLAVPEDLKKIMERHKEVKWSEVARKAIEQRVDDLEIMDKITAKSKLTQKDADEIGEKIKESIAKKLNIK